MNGVFWLEGLVRSALLLLVAFGLCRLSSRQTAAFRYCLVLLAFGLLALLPLLNAFMPEVKLPFSSSMTAARSLVTVREISTQGAQARADGLTLPWAFMVWAVGAALSLVPLVVGFWRARRLAGRAKPFSDVHLPELAKSFTVALSSEVPVPLVCGLLRPCIILPAAAANWSESRLRSVLLHERAHLRRHDISLQAMAHLICALWWFQPLAWLLRRKLRNESEFACDAEAIAGGVRPTDYAADLLAVARSISNLAVPRAAVCMVRSSALEERLQAVLHPPAASRSLLRAFAFLCTLAGLSLTAAVLNPQSQTNFPEGGSNMKRTILSALLTASGLSAATVSGLVNDANGNAIADVKVMIVNPDTHATQEATSGADGKFSFDGAAAGQYILRAEKPGLVSVFREFDLKSDSQMMRAITMPESGQVAADKVTNGQEETRQIRVGGRVAESNLVRKVQPIYPAEAKASRSQGTVEIEANISKDGVPIELRVVSSPNDELSQASLEAVRQWRYRPTLLNGNPVEITTTVIVNYTLMP